jgi:internalin A
MLKYVEVREAGELNRGSIMAPTKRSLDKHLVRASAAPLGCYLSYSHHDGGEYALQLTKWLTSHGFNVLNDDIRAQGTDFVARLDEQIRRADILIILWTPDAYRSHWVEREMAAFYDLTRGTILPIVFRDAISLESMPFFLQQIQWAVEEMDALRKARPSEGVLRQISMAIRRARRAETRRPPSAPQEKRPLNEGKLILVGRGEVGKTSLIRRLTENDFSGDEPKTEGIKITNWSLRCGAEDLRLNVWDFGGQEIMHATHQFFLTERSLYLLVLNGREGGEDVDAEYWLKHIQSFGGDSPVIVVQNKTAQHPFELNYRGLQVRYPQINGFVKTDCKEKIGIDELGNLIQSVVVRMPEIGMSFPGSWLNVKTRLESMKDDYLSSDSFRELCREEGVEDDADKNTLCWLLHCLGVALNYRDDSRLSETTVLKPEWVTQGVYKILNARGLAERRGELNLADLETILPTEQYPRGKHLFLVELMRKFSLCFPFPDATDRYLVPELLGKEEPKEVGDFPPTDCLNFEYEYSVLPEGLIPRFIVRSHTLSRGQARWRSGVILAHEECKALIAAEPTDRRLVVRVKGGDSGGRRRLLAIIRYDLDRMNAEFKDRLDAQAKVPLSDFPAFSVDYKKLIAFEKQGVKEFPEFIGQHVVNVNVNELLNGIDFAAQREAPLAASAEPTSIFFSYSHKDEMLRDELETHLKLLQRQGVVSTWHDRKILSGSEWDREIDRHLETARIILLLISADFIASEYCWGTEVKLALERHKKREATVIPIMLRSCDWKSAPFAKLNGLPRAMKPVTGWDDPDAAWTDVALGIRAVVESTSVAGLP